MLLREQFTGLFGEANLIVLFCWIKLYAKQVARCGVNGELYNLITKDVAMLCRDVAMFLQIDYKRCGYVKQRCGSVRPIKNFGSPSTLDVPGLLFF